MADKLPALGTIREVPAFAQRGGSLSISTSTPRPKQEVMPVQSPPYSAQPHPPAVRTFSGPAAIPSTSSVEHVLEQATSPVSPNYATYTAAKKNIRFEGAGHELKSSRTNPTPGSPKRVNMGMRRHSADPKVNVHTECGRHGDDWLFGGWKKLLERKDS